MRVVVLPRVAELCNGLRLAVGDEDRVVAEPLGAARLRCDRALEDAGAAELRPVGRDRDELGDVARAPICDTVQLAEELGDRGSALGGVARGVRARASAEGGDFDSRVLADRPAADAVLAEARLHPPLVNLLCRII